MNAVRTRTKATVVAALVGLGMMGGSGCELQGEEEAAVTAEAAMTPGAEEAYPGEVGPSGQARVMGRVVEYQVIDGWAIAEGDIVLGRAEEVARASRGWTPRTATRTNTDARWASGFVPYVIDARIGAAQKADIQSAIDHWNSSSVFYLYPRTTEGDYVQFVPGSGCKSPVGRQGGRQDITLASGCGRGATIHEIGHSLGMWHEQSRDDRDRYVSVKWENIEDGKAGNFKTFVENGADGQSPWSFDFGSIMLYDSYAFSKNDEPTLVKRDGSTFSAQRGALSDLDIAGITRFLTRAVTDTVLFELRVRDNECLSTLGNSRARQARFVARACDGGLAQRFYWFKLPTINDLRLVHYASGMCLDVPNASTANDVAAQIFPCHGYDNQAWTLLSGSASGSYLIKMRHSGKCLQRSATGTANGASVLQATCNAQLGDQQWRLVPKT